MQFVYDGLNRCVKRTTNGVAVYFSYDGWKPIAEWDASGALLAWNMYGTGPDEILTRYRQSDASYLHYHADQFGSVKFLLNASNVGVEKYTYAAFRAPKITDWSGNILTDSAYGNRFMFTGREYLSTIGIYDYRNRMYSPLIGRFLQTDPRGFDAGDNNLYRYVRNNPGNLADPTGDYVDMLGFSANFGFVNMTSFTAQCGFSYGWRNPLDWTIGYNVSYVDFGDSWTSIVVQA